MSQQVLSRRARPPRVAAPANRVWPRVKPAAVGSAATAALLVIWQVATLTGAASRETFPAPSDIAVALAREAGTRSFWAAIGATGQSWAVGLVISIVVATLLALVVGTYDFALDSTWVLLELMRPVPPIALLPVGLLLFGTGQQMKLLLIVYTTFWPLFTQIVYGIRDLDNTALSTMRVYRVSRARRLLYLVLPTVAPYAGTGLRLAAVSALVVSLVTEIVGGAKGLGQAIAVAQLAGNYSTMYAGVLVTGVLGLVINALFSLLQKRALYWVPRDTGVTTT